jgi:hypothetical protein
MGRRGVHAWGPGRLFVVKVQSSLAAAGAGGSNEPAVRGRAAPGVASLLHLSGYARRRCRMAPTGRGRAQGGGRGALVKRDVVALIALWSSFATLPAVKSRGTEQTDVAELTDLSTPDAWAGRARASWWPRWGPGERGLRGEPGEPNGGWRRSRAAVTAGARGLRRGSAYFGGRGIR